MGVAEWCGGVGGGEACLTHVDQVRQSVACACLLLQCHTCPRPELTLLLCCPLALPAPPARPHQVCSPA